MENILGSYNYTYQETLFRLPEKQKELLITIAKEDKVKAATSQNNCYFCDIIYIYYT